VLSLESRANDSLGVSAVSVIRSQLQSIADEVVDQAKLDTNGQVILWVEGQEQRALTENAFIEVLQKKRHTIVLNVGTSLGQTLHVFLLISEFKLQKLIEKYLEREIHTILEAKTIMGAERKVQLLGTYHRESKDTAQIFPSTQILGMSAAEDASVMQQLLTPIIIIGGAILIVYLLFTVRS
jgi:hypothetical protein